ncbi:MAG TPA: HlyD family efflux transporter periplasmic adaptor subunit [Thermoanaerobaculia bacterium]|nr:HlyD family efflux transporter periplasmic adaptor subunit [Thermoanaerobaculia bacterium]
MDRDITHEEKRRNVRRIATAVVAIAAAAFCLAATVEWLRPSLERRDIVLARVERGAVEATLQASGTVVPLIEQVVSSPVEARVLRVGRRAGAPVKAGDELLTLDTAATRLDVDRLGDRVSAEQSENVQLRLRLDETIASLRAQLEQKKLDAEIVHYTATQKEKLRSEGLTAEADALAAQAQARKTNIELRQLNEALARAEQSRRAQLAAAQSELVSAMRDREESRRQLDLAMLRADRDGVLTWVVPEEGATVRRGDVVARIADLSSYRVTGTISDVHSSRIAPGMRAWVKLDGESLGGVVDSVDPRIEAGVMKFSVTLDAPSHPRLRNNLRADVLVVTGRRTNTLVVRRGALGRTNSSTAFVIRGENAVRVPVRFGLGGDETIEIVSGLSEGDQVVISDVSEYEDIEKIRIK